MKRLPLTILLILAGCAHTAQQQADDASALQSAVTAVLAYSQSNDSLAATNALAAVGYFLRSLQNTPQAASTPAVASAVQSAGVQSPSTASTIASAVSSLVANGHSANDANELVAEATDAAVTQASAAQVRRSLPRALTFAAEPVAFEVRP
jgi:hypothetical protein